MRYACCVYSAVQHITLTMPSIAVVQGASRGIGLQFCRTLLQRTEVNVIATCRCPDQALDLNCLYKEHKERLKVMKMDVTQEDAIKETAEMVEQQFKKVDLLINCAAMLHPSGRGETSLRDVSFEVRNCTVISAQHSQNIQWCQNLLQKKFNLQIKPLDWLLGVKDNF